MSKSTSMLPTLAGGSGVAAHTLVDADLMKVVDAVTLNADRDRKVTLGELQSYFRNQATFEHLHVPACTGNQLLATIPNWNGSAGSGTVQYGILKRDEYGIFTLDFVFHSPTAPAAWTNTGALYVELLAGSGAGTYLWDAFLTKLLAEQAAGYGILFIAGQTPRSDFHAPIIHCETAEMPLTVNLPVASYIIPAPATHKLTIGCIAGNGAASFWSDVVKPSQYTSFRFTISTRVPV